MYVRNSDLRNMYIKSCLCFEFIYGLKQAQCTTVFTFNQSPISPDTLLLVCKSYIAVVKGL